ncbi:F-box protein At4g00893-like [Lotus japonicus]|uniref:F-box protein At4g00893-like n=1 Tax=Lotus japonicus TaxID=34305 RepID=UPI00258A06BA|nr:F-box protein At4g00893-like [Lotus japonicus]
MSKVEGWSNLPYDVLLHIIDGLGLKELQSLRGVCKDWRDLVSKTLVEKIESFGSDPRFLVYDYDREAGSKCFMLRYEYYLLGSLIRMNDNVKISLTIPELDGATCLESCGGGLLVFRGGSMFFFCPFSIAKIDLPRCPAFTELELSSGYVAAAAFSAPPTSQNCIVVVITHWSNDELQLQLISRGHDTWAKYKFYGA